MDDDAVVHLWVKMDEDPVVKHVCLQLNTWQEGVALSCGWVSTFNMDTVFGIIAMETNAIAIANQWIPLYGVSVLLFQNSMREFFSYRLCAVSEIFSSESILRCELQNIDLRAHL